MKSKIDILKTEQKFSKIIWNIGQRAFLFILIFILIDLIFGAFIFYKYAYLTKQKDGEVSEKIFEFDELRYQKVLNKIQNWQ